MNEHEPSQALSADKDLCLGAGSCVSLAPHIFSQDEEFSVSLLAASVEGPDVEFARTAAEACPAGAIALNPLESRSDEG